MNESDRFVYEESEPEEKTNKTKKSNKTMNSISESEKSRDHGSKKTQAIKKPKVEDEDDDIGRKIIGLVVVEFLAAHGAMIGDL